MAEKYCMFCEERFSVANPKAREHILKKSWIEALGHDSTKIVQSLDVAGKVQEQRSILANAFLTGPVCKGCNSGWMKDLDESVSPLILGLARAELDPGLLSLDERKRLSKWLLKTACVNAYAAPPALRHLPRAVIEGARDPHYLPKGFLAYFCKPADLGESTRALGASMLNRWRFDPYTPEMQPPSLSEQLKCAFQYDHIILGCCWLSGSFDVTYQGFPPFHRPLFLNECEYDEFRPYAIAEDLAQGRLGAANWKDPLNYIQALLSARLRSCDVSHELRLPGDQTSN